VRIASAMIARAPSDGIGVVAELSAALSESPSRPMISSAFLAALTADSLEGSKRVTRTQLRTDPGPHRDRRGHEVMGELKQAVSVAGVVVVTDHAKRAALTASRPPQEGSGRPTRLARSAGPTRRMCRRRAG
jgi:hypothetical protein